MSRILRTGGSLAACTYVHGKRALTDLLIKYYYGPIGWFAKPFLSEDDVSRLLDSSFDCRSRQLFRSMLVFNARRRQA